MSSITIVYLILAVIASFAITYFQYFYNSKATKENVVMATLRFLGVLGLLVLLINPQLKSQQLEVVKPKLNVLVDNSSSISFAKQDGMLTGLVDKLKSNNAIQKKFEVNYYAFDADLHQQDTFNFTSPKTNILKTLQSLETITKGSASATILITDGNQTYGGNYEFFKSNQPIYSIVVGDTIKYDDIKIHQVNVNSYVNLKHKFPVEIFVQYNGNKAIQKRLTVSLENRIVYKSILSFDENKTSQKLEFYLNANTIGKHLYTCTIETLAKEKNTLNNSQNFNVEVIDEQAKILLLTSINHPDISMIKRAVESNNQRKINISTNLNKSFQFKDYQLVILYQPNIKFKKIFKDINTNSINFFMITGTKTDWNFLDDAQPYFKRNASISTEQYSASFNSSFNEFIIDDIGFSNFPPLEDYFGSIDFKTDYKTILNQTISGYSTENPLLVTLIDGNRRGAVLFGENSWKWRMLTKVEHKSYEKFDSFFSKLIQYLSSDKRSSRLKINYKSVEYANKEVRISAQFFDANYVFDATAKLTLILMEKGSKKIKKVPFTLKMNSYEVVLTNLRPSDYTFSVLTENNKHKKNGRFKVLPYSIEQQLITANTSSLKRISIASNGNLFTINETNTLYKELLSDNKYATIQKSTEKIVSLFDIRWLLSIPILLFSLEWFIRKYKGYI